MEVHVPSCEREQGMTRSCDLTLERACYPAALMLHFVYWLETVQSYSKSWMWLRCGSCNAACTLRTWLWFWPFDMHTAGGRTMPCLPCAQTYPRFQTCLPAVCASWPESSFGVGDGFIPFLWLWTSGCFSPRLQDTGCCATFPLPVSVCVWKSVQLWHDG